MALRMELQQWCPDWLNQQCSKVSDALDGLSVKEKRIVLEQMMDYLRMEEEL